MRIMIVDDNEGMRSMLKSATAAEGVEYCECEDGGEAVGQYSQFQPDLVLMDLELPSVDGISAAGELTAMFPEATVVVVTNYDDDELRDKALKAGAKGFVSKERLHELRSYLQTQ